MPSQNSTEVQPANLDVHGVAEFYNISAKTVSRLVKAGDLPQPLRLGRLCRWSVASLPTSPTSAEQLSAA